MKVTVTERFVKATRGLPPNRQKAVARALSKFMREPRLPSLDFRALAGAPGFFIIDPTSGDRVILRKISDEEYEAVDVGPHDIYRRWNR